ncbi:MULTISPECIES: DUF7065 domain-containing protein [Protofrankia]|nr:MULTISPECIES: hypothetical protein [Protofrankia]
MSADLARFEGVVSDDNQPLWNQSYYLNFYDPRTRVGCFVRMGLLENQRHANNWLIVFRDGLPVFVRTNLTLPYTDDRPEKGIALAGVRMRSLSPLSSTRVTFAEGDFSLDLRWDTTYPLADCIALTRDAEGSFAREMAQVHLEGPCTVAGQVTVRGRRTEVTGTGFRDVAAGVRNWDGVRHYRLAWPVFDDGTAFAGVHGVSTGGADAYMRMFHDGREWLRVTRIDDHNEYAPGPFQVSRMDWAFTDERGRMSGFTARPLFSWLLPQDSFVICEQMMEYRLADGTLGYGLCEGGFRLPWSVPSPTGQPDGSSQVAVGGGQGSG